MRTSDFDYALPGELIAQYPSESRDESRLLVFRRDTGQIEHRMFRDIAEYLHEGDALVVNESEVIPARLLGHKKWTGGRVEMFLLREISPTRWEVLVRPAARIREGTILDFGDGALKAEVIDALAGGKRIVELSAEATVDSAISELGQVPLPPYIDRPPEELDRERYQTVYARVRGAVAAPTAGLHFTDPLLKRIGEDGVLIVRVLLHVGLGTFRPVADEDPAAHDMESEYYELSGEAAAALGNARARGGRIVAVGTTSVRVLETVAADDGTLSEEEGWTDLFIRPPHAFRAVDILVTNFHLPRSTLLMLVCAFGGREQILNCYEEAVRRQYRFYSYGDAMLIL